MRYKGYAAHVEFDDEDGVLHGRVEGIGDVVTFEAESADDLEREFQINMDVYLDWCEETGREPDRPAEPLERAVS